MTLNNQCNATTLFLPSPSSTITHPTAMGDNLYHLEECVRAAQQCVQTVSSIARATFTNPTPNLTPSLLYHSFAFQNPQCCTQQERGIVQLTKGIKDLPRLTSILHNERVSPRPQPSSHPHSPAPHLTPIFSSHPHSTTSSSPNPSYVNTKPN
jgi:hypothetical protein